MKKFLLAILAVMVSVTAYADIKTATASGTSATGILFKTTSATAITGTGTTTTIPPGSILKKLMILPGTTAANPVTITAWDAPNGVTYSTGARMITLPFYSITPAVSATGPYVIDFSTPAGQSEGFAPGLVIKDYLVVESAGTNSINAIAVFSTGLRNKIQGTFGTP